MKKLPNTRFALMLRTDFSNDPAWEAVCAAVQEPSTEFKIYGWEFKANVQFLSDPEYDDLSLKDLADLVPPDFNHSIIFLVDRMTLSHPEHPLLVVDLYEEPGRTFRVIPSEMWAVENNLSIANMSFFEFADNIDPDGIFRGFPKK